VAHLNGSIPRQRRLRRRDLLFRLLLCCRLLLSTRGQVDKASNKPAPTGTRSPASIAPRAETVTAEYRGDTARFSAAVRRQGNLARDRFALSFPCIFPCACAVALLAYLFEASLKLSDALLGERQLVSSQGAGHVGGLGEAEHGGARPARWGACA
jgi:hypothetical protein